MPVIRVVKNKNFTTMSNYHLRDQNLSLKAKGLLSFCLSLPDSWDYSVSGLVKVCKEGRDCVMATLLELEQRGYLHRERLRNADGTLGAAEYVIYEQPPGGGDEPVSENPTSGNPMSENPTQVIPMLEESALGNPLQINTNLINTKRNKYERKKESGHFYGKYQNVFLTDSEYEKLQGEFPSDWQSRIERLSEYMASTGKHYKSHLATIRSWARRDAAEPTKQGYRHENYQFNEGDSL